MRIGELARHTGVSVRALRYYEEQGLLSSERTTGGHREYVESDVARIRFVQCMFTAGLPSRRVVELLPFLDTGVATTAMVQHFDAEHARISEQIEQLTTALERLASLRTIAEQSLDGRPGEECRLSAIAAAAA